MKLHRNFCNWNWNFIYCWWIEWHWRSMSKLSLYVEVIKHSFMNSSAFLWWMPRQNWKSLSFDWNEILMYWHNMRHTHYLMYVWICIQQQCVSILQKAIKREFAKKIEKSMNVHNEVMGNDLRTSWMCVACTSQYLTALVGFSNNFFVCVWEALKKIIIWKWDDEEAKKWHKLWCWVFASSGYLSDISLSFWIKEEKNSRFTHVECKIYGIL